MRDDERPNDRNLPLLPEQEGVSKVRPDRLDREGRPKPKNAKKVEQFTIILDALQGGKLTTCVPREFLLDALDDYTAKGRRWLVVPA